MKLPSLAAVLISVSLAACDDGAAPSQDAGTDDASEPRDAAGGDTGTSIDASDAAPQSSEEGGANYAFPCLFTREPTGEATFEAIYVDIFCKRSCTDGYCHGPRGSWGDLSMTTIEGAYAALVDQPTGKLMPVDGRPTCSESDLLRVVPGDAEQSLLYRKVVGTAGCGTPMPPPDSGRQALTLDEREQVRAWIEAGAPLSASP